MNKLKNLIKNFREAPSKIAFIVEYKVILMAIIYAVSSILRFIISYIKGDIFLESLTNSLEFASLISASIIAILIYFKDFFNKKITYQIFDDKYTAIFGLGDFNRALLTNELVENNRKYVLFEQNIKNKNIEYFIKMGVGIVDEDIFNTLNLSKIKLDNMEYAIISMGNDRLNIELSILLIDFYKKQNMKTPIKIITDIVNKDLNTLFHQKFIVPQKDNMYKIDIKTFSFYDEISEKFFEQNFIDGKDSNIIKSNDDYNIIIIGNGELALSFIYQIAQIAHLPNQNLLHLHIVDKNAEKFASRVIKQYNGIDKVLKLHSYNLDDETSEFYIKSKNSIWDKNNLTHIIICYDDDNHNLILATQLFDKTYLSNVVDNNLNTQISCALFNSHIITNKINLNQDIFQQFYSFGDMKSISTRDRIIDEREDMISKLIHKGYAQQYNPNFLYNLEDKNIVEEINNKWFDSSLLIDKLSNKAQSKHISIKLKSLGLKYCISNDLPKKLLKDNKFIFNSKIEDDIKELGINTKFLKEYSKELSKLYSNKDEVINIKYFPKEYKTIFEKLIRAEHNRWNAFYYLNGWKFNEIKSKSKKHHNCLLPLEEFDMPSLQVSIIYDIYSILYIPNYLANSGFKIISIEGEEDG